MTTETAVTFFCTGVPVPQGSMKAFMPRNGRVPIVTSDNKKTKPWRADVRAKAEDMFGEVMPGPVSLRLEFVMPRPKSAPKRVVWPATRPDLDKLTRAIGDALKGVAYRDDSQVCRIAATKRYAVGDEVTGVSVTVEVVQ
jgi:crossover junction endodeoxyribonuclease RusA